MDNTTFIAYAHEPESQHAAKELATRLKRDGVSVWMDQSSLKPGDEWQPAMESALQNASTVLAIVGKSGLSKGMLEKELQSAINQKKTVIPVLTVNADYKDIPTLIQSKQAVTLSDKDNAYEQLLGAIGVSTLSTWQRLRSYVANE